MVSSEQPAENLFLYGLEPFSEARWKFYTGQDCPELPIQLEGYDLFISCNLTLDGERIPDTGLEVDKLGYDEVYIIYLGSDGFPRYVFSYFRENIDKTFRFVLKGREDYLYRRIEYSHPLLNQNFKAIETTQVCRAVDRLNRVRGIDEVQRFILVSDESTYGIQLNFGTQKVRLVSHSTFAPVKAEKRFRVFYENSRAYYNSGGQFFHYWAKIPEVLSKEVILEQFNFPVLVLEFGTKSPNESLPEGREPPKSLLAEFILL